MKISLCMPTWKHPELTDEWFRLFFLNSDFEKYEFEVCIADQEFTPETQAVIEKWNQAHPGIIKVKYNEENRGFPGGTNDAIRMATGDYIVCISNDVHILGKEWTDQLLKPHLDGHRCITGGQYIDYNSLTFVEGKIFEYIGGWCMCFPKSFIDELKEVQKRGDEVFDETCAPGYFEDVIISFFAKYILGYALIAPGKGMDGLALSHIGGQTLNQQSAPVNAIAHRNQIYFADLIRFQNAKHNLGII